MAGVFSNMGGGFEQRRCALSRGMGVVNLLPLLLAHCLCYPAAAFVNSLALLLICWRWQWVIVVVVVVVWAGWRLLNLVTWQ